MFQLLIFYFGCKTVLKENPQHKNVKRYSSLNVQMQKEDLQKQHEQVMNSFAIVSFF